MNFVSILRIWLPLFIFLLLFFTPQSNIQMTGGGKKLVKYPNIIVAVCVLLFGVLVYREYDIHYFVKMFNLGKKK